MYAEDPWKKIDSETLKAFPTKKDLYLFLSDNALIIDDGDMYFWLDKLSGKKCFYLVPEKLSIPEPDGWHGYYSYYQLTLPFKIEGKISTSVLSSNTTYTAYRWFDFTSSLDFSGFGEEEPLKTFVGIDGGCESESRIVYIPFMPSKYHRKKLKCRPPDMPILSGPQYPRRRDDDWYELELGDYFNKECGGDDNRELKMCLSEFERVEASMNIWLACIDLQWKPRTEFWENEWIKHGQMGLWGKGDIGALSYFLDGIKARQNIGLLQILERGKIAFNTKYTKKEMVDVLHSSLGIENVYLACSSRGRSY
ncbi:hypothetical protein POM88_051780 [Heracleum sosnowskyi]|uniref:Uncharacterized protein n=1 Tax=Heracleum sosnowskyi TaxID=360622 RepID=A0AAD8H148_9APIA|nr:hypothetical protein POM88_051780 [Heracleum sosnowskyi]